MFKERCETDCGSTMLFREYTVWLQKREYNKIQRLPVSTTAVESFSDTC